ncbi:MAG: hypothetical protein ACOWWO_13560 [Peptococcaceae bacterium]
MEENYGLFGSNQLEIIGLGQEWTLKVEDGSFYIYYPGESRFRELRKDFSGLFTMGVSPANHFYISYKNHLEQIICHSLGEDSPEIINIGLEKRDKITFQKIGFSGDKMYVIIITENFQTKEWKIRCCFKRDGLWQDSFVIDKGWGNGPGGCAAVTQGDVLYLIYQIYQKGKYQLVYRMGKESQWGLKSVITSSQGININPAALFDQEGNLHITWLRLEHMNARVMYTRKFKTKGVWLNSGWLKEQCISSKEGVSLSPLIYLNGAEIEIFWQENEYIHKYAAARQLTTQFMPVKYFAKRLALDIDQYPGIDLAALEPDSTAVFLLLKDAAGQQSGEEVNPPLSRERRKVIKYYKNFGQSSARNRVNDRSREEKIAGLNSLISRLEEENSKKTHQVNVLQEKEALQALEIDNLQQALQKEQDQKKQLQQEVEKLQNLTEEVLKLRQSLEVVKATNNQLRNKFMEKEDENKALVKNLKELEMKSRKPYPQFPFRRRI